MARPSMCLGIPGEVVGIEGTQARIRIRGRETVADTTMAPVRPGDFVIVYAGLVVQVLDPEEAQDRLRLLEESGQ